MNELIIVENKDGRQVVSAKELYLGLGLGKGDWSRWYPTNIENNEFFKENENWVGFSIMRNGNETKDFAITIEFAKHIAMMARTEKSHLYRNYFLECEKQLLQPQLPRSYKEALLALIMAEEEKELLQLENAQSKQIIAELQPKASYYDLILQSEDVVSITQIAKDYGMSAKTFNEILHELGIQYKLSNQWLMYQKHADKGYTKSKTHSFKDKKGNSRTALHTYWTQAGRLFIYHTLKSQNIVPVMETEEAYSLSA